MKFCILHPIDNFLYDNSNFLEQEDLPEATEMATGEIIQNNIRNIYVGKGR
jgi:hypothetical protein